MIPIVEHLGRDWILLPEGGSWWVVDDLEARTGPFSTEEEARDWVLAILPAGGDDGR
jgi:hypothetical protein